MTCVTFCMSSRTSASEHLKDDDKVMWGKELWAPFQPTLYLDFCQNKLNCCCNSPTWYWYWLLDIILKAQNSPDKDKGWSPWDLNYQWLDHWHEPTTNQRQAALLCGQLLPEPEILTVDNKSIEYILSEICSNERPVYVYMYGGESR